MFNLYKIINSEKNEGHNKTRTTKNYML